MNTIFTARARSLLLICSLATVFSAKAADTVLAAASAQADNLVVSANRQEQDRLRVGSTVYVVTAEEIELHQYRQVTDVLRTIPGVSVTQNSVFGGSATVKLRGAAADQALVLVDGIAVNDPTSIGGAYNFASFNTDDIARIEVLTGPQSTLYGSDAMSGVINIITKSGQGQATVSGYAEAGSYSTDRLGAQFASEGERVSGRLSVDYMDTVGISKADENNGNAEKDGYDNLTISGRLAFQLAEDFSITATGRYFDSETEYDNGFGPVDGDFLNTNTEYLAGLSADFVVLEKLSNKLSVFYSEIETRDGGADNAFPSASEGDRTSIAYQGSWSFSDSDKLLFGAEYEDSTYSRPLDPSFDESLDSTAVYTMYQFAPTKTLDFTVGLRNDKYDLGDGYTGDDSKTTGRLTGAWNIPNSGTTLRASWGQGFKAPSIFQRTYTEDPINYPPNLALKPQTNEGWEIGMEYRDAAGTAYTQLTYFFDETEDQINYVYNPDIGAFGAGRYENIEEVRRNGIELVFGAELAKDLSFRIAGSRVEAIDRATDQQVSRIPEYTASVNLTWQALESARMFADMIAQSEQDDSPFNDRVTPGYGVVNLGGEWDATRFVTLYARVENVLDKEYQEVLGYGMPDRSVYVGVRARWGD